MATDRQPAAPAPVTTALVWEEVVGNRLEELIHGLFDAMGANELVWRAGANDGVTAADGGRDLEAVFKAPLPDGTVQKTRFWVEAKGRRTTVPRAAVVASVNEMTAHPDVDVFVFCTNSRFSNPTRDWVTKWQETHPRPQIQLWDRDHLARLVRHHPTVAARSLPEALENSDRLDLLLGRFHDLGETPSVEDLQYFWQNRHVVVDCSNRAEVVSMFAYAEDHDDLVARPWASLLPTSELEAAGSIAYALMHFPRIAFRELARPTRGAKMLETTAYVLIASIHAVRPELTYSLLNDPSAVMEGDDPILEHGAYAPWLEHVVKPAWERVRDELRDACADDCLRVSIDPQAFPPALVGEQYWRRFGIGSAPPDTYLISEDNGAPCVVGLPLNDKERCPLFTRLGDQPSDGPISLDEIRSITKIVATRRRTPGGLARGPSLARLRERWGRTSQ